MARAPAFRAKSTAAPASAYVMPRRRKPVRVTKQVTAPDGLVGLFLGSAVPGDPGFEQKTRVGGAGLDGAPTGRLAVEIGDETGRCARPRMP